MMRFLDNLNAERPNGQNEEFVHGVRSVRALWYLMALASISVFQNQLTLPVTIALIGFDCLVEKHVFGPEGLIARQLQHPHNA